ncbi:hypothetical protein DFH08DRAFT_821177 [Mycena albidolilacea]|uniref:Uncharacterized protein n=1 Tax=Mycena albidolilacea TaxID=1033008 RepID=A0AAD7EDH7_9AGAR|nr:hypothetical protein DFH08DRAFT_821177 [Mycena albidolilacea]
MKIGSEEHERYPTDTSDALEQSTRWRDSSMQVDGKAIEQSKEKARLRKARYRWQALFTLLQISSAHGGDLHSKPEARAKQVAYVAERRAALKERRRHWDPPKESRMAIRLPPAKTPTRNGMGMLTRAEESAVSALLDMATGESGTATRGTLLPESRISLHSESLAPSSLHAVFEEDIAEQPAADGVYSTKPLPPYASPPTPLQNKYWRKNGIIGPITGIQHVQILVAELAQPPSDEGETDPGSALADPPTYPHLSVERLQHIQSWISHLPPPDHRKDQEARRAAMELHLNRWVRERRAGQ